MIFRIRSTLYKIVLSGIFFLPLLSVTARATGVSTSTGMSFGLIEFTSNAQGDLTLGSNGAVTVTGTGLSYLGGAVAGRVDVTGTSGTVELRCSATSTLGGAGGGTLEVTNIEASVGAGVAAGSGTVCEGDALSTPNPVVVDLVSFPNPTVYFGGKLNIPMGGITASQSYQSSNGGGAPLSVSAVFQ